ncbi:DUF6333 family protein [Streptomyces sp. NPDC048644]|uniref:DUF6333 family protein n=1 Tax=Streptomyces sp. NPDC048644 TaxID=3365582 RepID=UPI00371799C7
MPVSVAVATVPVVTDTSFWTCPSDTAVRGSNSGEYPLTLVDPPLPGSIAELSSHDRVRARAFARQRRPGPPRHGPRYAGLRPTG